MSVQIEFKSDDVGIFKRFSFVRATSKWIDTVAPEVITAMKEEAPVRRAPGGGRLRDSITYRKGYGLSGVSVEFGSRVPYADFVENGTPPHVIRPRTAQVLRFVGRSGDVVYSHYVNHPGMRPNPFSRRAMERISPRLQREFREAVESQFRKD